MYNRDFVFTSESVSEGHPDKMADQISDAILDATLAIDPKARVACETLVKTGYIMLAGELSLNSSTSIPFAKIARDTVREIGYTSSDIGFDADTCGVLLAIEAQSADINQGVDRKSESEQGAGDQGIMFGYACRESDVLMPLPITIAHRLARKQAELRKSKKLAWLRPDAKAQVSVQYVNGQPSKVDAVVLSTQHDPDISQEDLRAAVIEEIIKPVIPAEFQADDIKFYVNPTGRFVIGGPMGDCGLTGRKIIVDTYGGMGRHGGGAFSGKDPSKVDRSASYMARYIAKNIVAAGLADRCEIQLAYAIGVAEPVSVLAQTYGTATIPEEKIEALIRKHFRLTPFGITYSLDLERPIYAPTAAYGHFGREDLDLPWERTDKVEALKAGA